MRYDLEVFIFSSWPVFSSSVSEVSSAFQLFGVRTRRHKSLECLGTGVFSLERLGMGVFSLKCLGMGVFSLTNRMAGREWSVILVVCVTLSENGYIHSASGCF